MTGGTSATLRLELLGPGQVVVLPEETPLEVPPSVLLLLTYLVLHGASPQHRDVVAASLWPDVTDHRARRRLSTTLWRTRTMVEGPTGTKLVTTDGVGRLALDRDAAAVDVLRFERVARDVLAQALDELSPDEVASARVALADCRGEILSGRYDEWLLPDRDRLAEIRERLVGHLATWYGRRCPREVAIDAVSELLAPDPGNECAHRVLIGLHSRAGDRALARRQLDRCRRALGQELGIEPSPATIAAAGRPPHPAADVPDPLDELHQLGRDLAQLQERLVRLVDAVRADDRDRPVTPR